MCVAKGSRNLKKTFKYDMKTFTWIKTAYICMSLTNPSIPMKKIFPLLFVLSIASLGVFAQSLQLQTSSGTVIPNGGTISKMVVLNDTTIDVEVDLIAKNISSTQVTVKVKKTAKSLVSPQTAHFCFAGGCFSDTTTYSPTQAVIAAGATDNSFSGHITPNNSKGSALVYYKFYNTRNLNDTVSVYIQTEIWPSGIDNLTDNQVTLGNAYPNPATSSFSIDYSVNLNSSARLVVRNLIGIKVREEVLSGTDGKAKFDVSDLPEGIYLYSVEIDGKNISAKKMLVRH